MNISSILAKKGGTVVTLKPNQTVDHGELIGSVSIGDVVKAALNEYAGEIETLQTRVEKG
jgi:hypothetical protein